MSRYKVLEQQMKVLKKKEKEEAMALEAVVKKAEENLQLTTVSTTPGITPAVCGDSMSAYYS